MDTGGRISDFYGIIKCILFIYTFLSSYCQNSGKSQSFSHVFLWILIFWDPFIKKKFSLRLNEHSINIFSRYWIIFALFYRNYKKLRFLVGTASHVAGKQNYAHVFIWNSSRCFRKLFKGTSFSFGDQNHSYLKKFSL